MNNADLAHADLDDFIIQEMSAHHLMGVAACIVEPSDS